MTNRLYQETLPTVAALDDLAKVANYSLIDTLNCDPDTQASTDHHTPRQVFTSRYVPVSLTPIRNSKYVAHSKINFHEHSFADSITQSVDVVSTAKIVRMINRLLSTPDASQETSVSDIRRRQFTYTKKVTD